MSDLTQFFHKADPTTVSAVIAVSGVILSALVSSLISGRANYLNAVTVERSKWIERLRNNISDCIGLLGYLNLRMSIDPEFDIDSEHNDLVKKIETIVATIKLQLNPNAPIDSNIVALLGALPTLAIAPDESYRDAERLLIRHSQFLLKEEWEKVKYEALGPARYLGAWYMRRQRARLYEQFCSGEGSIAPFVGAGT